MHNIDLLINIGVALCVAFVGGYLARLIKLPPIVGYLLAGVAIGPFTPGFVGDSESIGQLAELGVIFLMFGVGLHFSIHDLWRVRDIAVPGALFQMLAATGLGLALSQWWGWTLSAGLILGLAVSIASTVVLLRGLMDNGLLNTRHGKVAVGWLVLEDLATVLILVVLPVLSTTEDGVDGGAIVWALAKAGVFVGVVLIGGGRLVPWMLQRIAHTRSRELFTLLVLAVALGTALSAASIFGVSLALGAFLAGVIVSESPLSHQVGVEVLPFQEAFAVLFFVSVGMLVNPAYLLANAGQVLALTALIVIGKALIAAGIGFLFPHPARTALVVAAGLSQIGEFSFILGQAGLLLGLIHPDQYSLILAGALLSITVNPLMFRLIGPIERSLKRSPALWRRLNHHGPVPIPIDDGLSGHVVVVGWGRVGHHVVDVLEHVKVPRLVVETDAARVETLQRQGVPTLFGDAANSEILAHARLAQARALVITVPDEASAALIVSSARQLAPDVPIIARSETQDGVRWLSELGAEDVIHPELEGGLAIVRHTLIRLGLPLREVQRYTDIVRRDHYHLEVDKPAEYRILHQLLNAAQGIEVTWARLPERHPLVGQTLIGADIRSRTGVSVVALFRDGQLLPNPKSSTTFLAEDRIGLMGDQEDVAAAEQWIMDMATGVRSEA
ncbi:MAG: cation:proton antiporter [Anaerolineales bacterium]|nr:cation:proton antiporter [Anaerolineales bacterium]